MDSLLAHQSASRRHPSEPLQDVWTTLAANRPLPLRLALLPSRRPNKALCPVWQVSLRGNDGSSGYRATRILDPEHKQPYVSLSPIFLASGRSVIAGLLEFGLVREEGNYELHLAGLEPFDEVWAPLPVAMLVARATGLAHRLALLLDRKTRHAWSLDEGEAGVLHNWRAGPDDLDPAGYSTESLLKAEIGDVRLLPHGEAVRTLLSDQQRHSIVQRQDSGGNQEQRRRERMVRWSVQCYEAWRQVSEASELLRQSEAVDERVESQALLRQAVMLVADVEVDALSPTWHDVLDWMPNSGPVASAAPVLAISEQDRSRLATMDATKAMPAFIWKDSTPTEMRDRLGQLYLKVRGKMAMLHRMQAVEDHLSADWADHSDGGPASGNVPSQRSAPGPTLELPQALSVQPRREDPLQSFTTFLREVESSVQRTIASSLASVTNSGSAPARVPTRSDDAGQAHSADVLASLDDLRAQMTEINAKLQDHVPLTAARVDRPRSIAEDIRLALDLLVLAVGFMGWRYWQAQ